MCGRHLYNTAVMRPSGIVLVSALTLFLLFVRAELEAACPSGCHCDIQQHTVDCRGAGLDRIPWDLPDPSGLKQLDMRGNNIREIIAEIVSYTNLEYLDLSENKLLTVDDNVFDALPRLKYLYLQRNRMSSLTPSTFLGLNALIELDLSHNQLVQLEGSTFSDMGKLEELNLAGNRISDIKDSAFLGLEYLKYLDLSDNRLLSVPVIAFEKLHKLQRLKLDLNDIENVPSHAFKSLEMLRDLSLGSNGIEHVSEDAFQDQTGPDLLHLESLTLKSNKLTEIPTRAINHLSHLLSLDLSQNPIKAIDPDAFRGVDRLRNLYLNSMPELQVVRKFAFGEMTDLVAVEMHSNHALQDIEEEAFLATPSLRRVDLHANKLSTMSANLLEWDHVERLDLRYNPWMCDCHLQWLRELVLQLPTNTSRAYARQIRCAAPEDHASKLLVQLYPHEFKCVPQGHQFEDRIMLGIIGGICLVLLCVMVVLFYKHDYCVCFKKRRHSTYMMHTNNARYDVTRYDITRHDVSRHERVKRSTKKVSFTDDGSQKTEELDSVAIASDVDPVSEEGPCQGAEA